MKICIIGAGTSGLPSIKTCLEEGFKPICYERLDEESWLPWDLDSKPARLGLWSKEISAYSDFPPPVDFPNFLTESKQNEYLRLYSKQFSLGSFIKFGHTVTKVEILRDKWKVCAFDSTTNETTESIFDALMVCIGHRDVPLKPPFLGEDSFQGRMIHSHDYEGPSKYCDKTVLVVGTGNCGVQTAVEIAGVAKKVYLSTRRGFWLVPRLGKQGLPLDLTYQTRGFQILFKLLGLEMMCNFIEKWLNRRSHHGYLGFKPNHRALSQHPTINDELPLKVLAGQVVIKGEVSAFKEFGVIFKGEESTIHQINEVILATGYNIKFPFIDPSLVAVEDNRINLFKHVFSPQLPPTLAFIGVINSAGPRGPVAELQARWALAIFTKKRQLPSSCKMWTDISDRTLQMLTQYYASSRHTIQVNWLEYMDELAGMISAHPSLFCFLKSGMMFYYKCMVGPCLPYQFRLTGPSVWPKAKNVIGDVYRRVNHPLKTRVIIKEPISRHPKPINFMWVFFFLMFLMFVLLQFW